MKHLSLILFFLLFSSVSAHSSSCSNSHLPKKNLVDYMGALHLLDVNQKFSLTPDNPSLIGEVGNEAGLNEMVQTRVWVLRALYEYPHDIEHAQFFLGKMKELSNFSGRTAWTSNWAGAAKDDLKRLARNLFELTLLSFANRQPYIVLTHSQAIEPMARLFAIREDPLVASQAFPHEHYLAAQKEILHRIEIEKFRLLSGKAFQLAVRNEHAQAAWKRAFNTVGAKYSVPPEHLKDVADEIGIRDYEPKSYRYGGRTDD